MERRGVTLQASARRGHERKKTMMAKRQETNERGQTGHTRLWRVSINLSVTRSNSPPSDRGVQATRPLAVVFVLCLCRLHMRVFGRRLHDRCSYLDASMQLTAMQTELKLRPVCFVRYNCQLRCYKLSHNMVIANERNELNTLQTVFVFPPFLLLYNCLMFCGCL